MTSNLQFIDNFFKPGRLDTKLDALILNNLPFQRMYLDYYLMLINEFKNKIPLEISIKKSIRESSWEPLFKAAHHGIIMSLKNFLPDIKTNSESGKLVTFFEILQRCGFGTFDLGLATPGSIMTIVVSQSLENYSDLSLNHSYDTMVSPFTGGLVLACYNLAMSSMPETEINSTYVDKLYNESPDVIQSSYGLLNEECSFSFFI